MDRKLLQQVGDATGVSGYEIEIQDLASKILRRCCDEVEQDRLGNVIALKKATRPDRKQPIKLALAAHADEVGMMVTHIDGKGYISFRQMGGLGADVAQSQRVVIHGKKAVGGVVVPKGAGKDGKGVALDALRIDTGLERKALCKLVAPGDIVTFDEKTVRLNDKTWAGRNFDDRIGTYCLLEAMRRVGDTSVDVYAISSVQEEVGLRGARVAAYSVAPDIGIALDGSMTAGAYTGEAQNPCVLGKGTGVYIVDRLTIGHRGLLEFLFKLCKKYKVPFQKNIGGGTDAAAFQQSRGGVISTTIGAPVRYMHSTVQLCHADDMDATVKLLTVLMEHAHEFLPPDKSEAKPKRRTTRKTGKKRRKVRGAKSKKA